MGNLQFDFTVDKSTNSVLVKKEFDAELSLVWDAFTRQEILDQWWAPKPWRSQTKSMDLEVGGRRFYAMVGPEGQEHWSLEQYTLIDPKSNLEWLSCFSDQDEKMNTEFPTSKWALNFTEAGGTTTVSIVIRHQTFADIEKHIQMGFKEGFTMTLNELERLLKTSNQ